MDRDAISLRPARPTHAEGLAYAHYAHLASEGFFRFLLGSRAEKIIADAFVQPNHDLSYQYTVFAESNGAIVGMYSGYTAQQHRSASTEELKRAVGFNLRARILMLVFAPLMRLIDSIADGDYYLQFIAVDGNARGSGVGSLLMNHVEEHARATGSGRITLDVSANNREAVEFYNHRHMQVESKWPRRLSLPDLTFYRMTKTL